MIKSQERKCRVREVEEKRKKEALFPSGEGESFSARYEKKHHTRKNGGNIASKSYVNVINQEDGKSLGKERGRTSSRKGPDNLCTTISGREPYITLIPPKCRNK